MKSAEEFLLSLEQLSLSSTAKSGLDSESASEAVEIPAELLIAVTRGLRVFPVIGYSRNTATRAGIETATSDLARIGYWLRHYHGYPLNWYVAAGPGPRGRDGVVALEVIGDPGRMSLCELCQDDWDWIDTLRSQAGNGTRYILFRWPTGMAMRRSVKQLAPGLILHGEGDSVPVPPSRTRSGMVHAYLTPCAAMAYAPKWLIKPAFQLVEAVAESPIDSIRDMDNGPYKQAFLDQPSA
jgi:hypothetical protein